MKSYHLTEWTLAEIPESKATSFKPRTYHAGDVIRSDSWNGAFSDMVILGFNEDGYAKLARPYCFASSIGTTGPVALSGVETLEMVRVSNLNSYYKVVSTYHTV